MKKILMLLFLLANYVTAFAQPSDVTVVNSSSCSIDVVVTPYYLGCIPGPSTLFIINAGDPPVNVFDATAINFEVRVVIDPGGANIVLPGVRAFVNPLCPVVSIATCTGTTLCGPLGTTGICIGHLPGPPTPSGSSTVTVLPQ